MTSKGQPSSARNKAFYLPLYILLSLLMFLYAESKTHFLQEQSRKWIITHVIFFPPFLILNKFTTQTTAPRGADLFVPLKCRHTVLVIRILKGRNMPEYFPYACLAEHICPSRIIARLRSSQRRQGHRGIRRPCRKLDLLGWVQLTHIPFFLFSSLPPPATLCCDHSPRTICMMVPSPSPLW